MEGRREYGRKADGWGEVKMSNLRQFRKNWNSNPGAGTKYAGCKSREKSKEERQLDGQSIDNE
jgi:hypothetical protein